MTAIKKPQSIDWGFWNVVGITRFELATPTMSRWCSNQLSYMPKCGNEL